MALEQRRILDPTPPEPGDMPPRYGRLPVPPVSAAIIGVCVVMFFFGEDAIRALALFRPAVKDGQWYRVLSAIIVHGGIFHLVMNMSVVWTLGFVLEREIASWRFLIISLITALGSSIAVLFLSPDVPTVGASGMILGWAGAMLPIATAHTRQSLITWLVQIAIISFLPFVSWQGHLGGFLFGLPCGLLLRSNAKNFGPASIALLVATIGATLIAISRGGTFSFGGGP